jgi:hypothetical protein
LQCNVQEFFLSHITEYDAFCNHVKALMILYLKTTLPPINGSPTAQIYREVLEINYQILMKQWIQESEPHLTLAGTLLQIQEALPHQDMCYLTMYSCHISQYKMKKKPNWKPVIIQDGHIDKLLLIIFSLLVFCALWF